jgi:DNA primase
MAAADDRDAEQGWLQAVTLHRKARTLHKELKDAEAALAVDPSEVNLARMVDIQQQLSSADNIDAAIEGFGLYSGRHARSV